MSGKILNQLYQNPRNTFLMDGIGAILSAMLLWVCIAPLENIFGLPKNIAFTLSFPIVAFIVYSFTCYFLHIKNWKPFLLCIAIANFLYCCTTAGVIISYYKLLTFWGIAYFIGEIVIILGVVTIEILVLKKNK